jgi:hypothetical protein
VGEEQRPLPLAQAGHPQPEPRRQRREDPEAARHLRRHTWTEHLNHIHLAITIGRLLGSVAAARSWGRLGQAVPIVAHAKEWVLNQFQQGKVASWLGTSISGLKGALGFGGGRKAAYKDGGEVKPYTVPSHARHGRARSCASSGARARSWPACARA